MNFGLLDEIVSAVTYAVTNIAELKAINPNSLGNRPIRFVKVPETSQKAALFYFDAATTAAELLPLIAIPDSISRPNPGGWINLSDREVRKTSRPAGAPPFIGIRWVATIAEEPAKRIEYESMGLVGTADWKVINIPVSTGAGAPIHIPDVIGERYIDTTLSEAWTATTLDAAGWKNDSAGGGGGTI